MKNEDCVAFLQWCLPRLGLRWAGFRKVRRTVCKRLERRIRILGLPGAGAYRGYLETHASEWDRLDAMCRIPISRFWRDREVFDRLAREVYPALAAAAAARGDDVVRVWSAGCACGEEPYSLRLAWTLKAEGDFPAIGLSIVATEIDETLLHRARAGLYSRGSLKDLPPEIVPRAFRVTDDLFAIDDRFRAGVTFLQQDIRTGMPDDMFDLILCRNLVFTYFDAATQDDLFGMMCARLRPGGALVIGAHETLPATVTSLVPWDGAATIYRYNRM